MLEIRENEQLTIKNVVSYRTKVKQEEMGKVGKAVEQYILELGAIRVGNPITTTYSVDGMMIDIEILMPIDKIVETKGDYVFKKEFKIVNAVVVSYRGNPSRLQEACDVLNNYIIENGLQPITTGYNVTKRLDMLNLENTEIDVYVGINPNIL